MSDATEPMPHGAPRPQPFLWSVRRELWEHRAIFIAPLAIEAVVLLGYAFASFGLPAMVRATDPASTKPGFSMAMHSMAAGSVYMISLLVGFFYCLAAFNGERRDRSLLFWKSLPVSDRTTVFAKAAVPMLVQPVVVLAIAVAAQLAMFIWSTVLVMLNGIEPQRLWVRVDLPFLWVMMVYAITLNTLWLAPVFGWLLLVSAWAKRAAFVWAIAPWIALGLFEFIAIRAGAFQGNHVWKLLDDRFFGGMALAITVGGQGKVPVASLAQLDPGRFFGHPGLWGGLLFFAACLAACTWLRRRHEPL